MSFIFDSSDSNYVNKSYEKTRSPFKIDIIVHTNTINMWVIQSHQNQHNVKFSFIFIIMLHMQVWAL